ncbi:MAG: RimK family alpha-L-glutamate ligase [Thermoanaerobaculia bacterium]
MSIEHRDLELVILFENREWQEPLFRALDRKVAAYERFDLKSAAFGTDDPPSAPVYFNQASPSAYARGNARAVPLALALIEQLESRGARLLNGSRAFRLELSKLAQISLMRALSVPHPRTVAFNDVDALAGRAQDIGFPAILKPNQGGSGARMFRVASVEELAELLSRQPELWLPDNLLLLQEYLPHDPWRDGIVRLEFLGGELLYAMRVVSDGSFNLCPSESCNPLARGAVGPEFFAYPEVPSQAVETGRRLFVAAGLDVGSIEYLETTDGRRVFYDINANSNLRPSVAREFDIDPFERLAEFVLSQRATPRELRSSPRFQPRGEGGCTRAGEEESTSQTGLEIPISQS